MKKFLALGLAMMMSVAALTGCGGGSEETAEGGDAAATSGAISVVSREDGSGTRGAFIELFGIEEKNDAGEKVDMTTEMAEITNSTAVMMTTVAGNPNAIGYISLGSLDDSVKALKIDGAEATAENIKNGTYKVARPFNIATKADVSEVASDFITFIMSDEGQAVVEENDCISQGSAGAYTASGMSGKIVVVGSSSITPVMEKLKEAYIALNPDVTIEIQQTGSGAGIESVTSGSVDIGNASRALSDKEKSAGIEENIVAIDGIAMITDKNNKVTNVTKQQLTDIYTGKITNWKDLGGSDEAIVVIGREAASGTRGAFEELLEVKNKCAYAQELDSTGAVLAKVAATPGAIGYVSLDVVDKTVAALKLDGVDATEDNIKAGKYTLSRPFVMATKGSVSSQSELVQTWFNFVKSDAGKKVIKGVGLILPE